MVGFFFNIAYQNTSSFTKMADFSVLMSRADQNPAGVKIAPFFEAPVWKQNAALEKVGKSSSNSYARSFRNLVAPGMDIDFYTTEFGSGSEAGPSLCPLEYPFAYYHGKYCCHYQKEKTFVRQHSGCDGSPLTYYSSCCFGNQFTACPKGKCKGKIIT